MYVQRTDDVVEGGCSPRVLPEDSVLYTSMIGSAILEAALLSKGSGASGTALVGKEPGLSGLRSGEARS
jgi:hypothetical protein